MPKRSDADKVISHIAISGCDDVLSRPFFCERLDANVLSDPKWRDFLLGEIGAALTQNPVAVGTLSHIAVPKGRYTFRTISQMSVIDTLKYTALVFSLGKKIESERLKKDIVFSNRFDNRRWTLDRSNYDGFRGESKKLSESGKYECKVITDISNFYDRLNLHKLENILKQIGCDQTIVKKINAILIQWSQQQSFGIPVGSDASRYLAEAMLINADKSLASHRVKFIRYVDDYRIFAKSRQEAYEAMQILDQALRREGLFLNSGKTKLIDLAHEAHDEEHFQAEFESIDIDQKVEKTKIVSTRYGSKIAKYYKFPGQEAIKELQKVNLNTDLNKISLPNTDEIELKRFVKAVIYQSQPSFAWFAKLLAIYPHLIPYVADAIVKEREVSPSRFSDAFYKDATKGFRATFRKYDMNDYFRIQSARVLCQIDDKCGQFLGAELVKMTARHEIVFSQVVQMLGVKLPRARLLDLLNQYANYGPYARTSLALALRNGNIIRDDERSAQMKNLQKAELDNFLAKLLRP